MRLLTRILGVLLPSRPSFPRGPARPSGAVPGGAERAYKAVKDRVDGNAAMDVVRFMDPYWRISGNPGFNASVDHIRDGLQAAGVANRVEEFKPRGRGWDYQAGTVSFADTGEVLLSRERDRVSLCINSFSTPGVVEAPLVDVGAGTPADYAGKNVKGAVVLGSAAAGQLWQQAVKARGAIGVISTAIAPYIRPDDPAKFTFPDQWDVFQWGSVPYDETAKAFGFKASLRAASKMRERLKAGAVKVKVDVRSTFYDGPSRFVVAEIPGTVKPDERIVMVAHIQEPGANDDGSGCGTLLALVVALHKAIAAKALPAPGRTLTFIWGNENSASRQWLTAHPEQAKGVQYMFSMDMTGEDVAKTGGTFLIEKQADPSAVWPRPSDPHTAWGASRVTANGVEGQPAERRAPGDLPAAREGHRLGREDESVRRGQRPHRVQERWDSVAPELAFHGPLLPHQPGSARQGERARNGERGHRGRDERVVPRVRHRHGRARDGRPHLDRRRRAPRAREDAGRDRGDPGRVAEVVWRGAGQRAPTQRRRLLGGGRPGRHAGAGPPEMT